MSVTVPATASPDQRGQGVKPAARLDCARKYSVTIAGHPTSLRLEPIFWVALVAESARQGLPISALVARIDAERLAVSPSPNLASAIRSWLFDMVEQRAAAIGEKTP